MTDEISDKKQAIFESTLHLVREHGFHGTPMSLVAKTAGVAAGTIYHYFDGKDDLICELYKYNRRRLVAVVNEAVAEGGTCREIFYRICSSLFGFYLNHPDVLVFFEQFLNSPYRDAMPENNFDSRPLEAFLSNAVQRELFKDIPVRIFISTLMCTVVSSAKMKLAADAKSDENELEQTIGVLWDGFLLRRETPQNTFENID